MTERFAPKCEECGQFIPWDYAVIYRVLRYDMQHEPYEDDVQGGLCDKCRGDKK